jgi:septal ring factor EnvC (AmiA/AmiB activator)
MSPRTAIAGWVFAAMFAAAAAFFASQYAQARRAADQVRRDYESLQVRVEEQARQNREFDATLKSLAQQLEAAQSALKVLDQAVQSAPPPALP